VPVKHPTDDSGLFPLETAVRAAVLEN